MTKLSENIKNLRILNKMTQEDLAEKLSVTRQTVSCWENEKSEPDIETIFKISDIFNTEVSCLLNTDNFIPEKTAAKNKTNPYVFIPFILVFIFILSIIFMLKVSDDSSFSPTKKHHSDYTKSELVYDELSGRIVIDTFYDYEQISKYAEEFVKIHPNVNITVNTVNTYGSFEGYKKWIDSSLKNNYSTDIIDMAQISSEKYSKQGLLCDLNQFIDNDLDFSKDEYYINVLAANEYSGGLYSIPFYFYYDIVFMSKTLLDKAGITPPQNIDYKKMLEIHKEVTKNTDYTPKIAPGILKTSFWDKELPLYYSFETKIINFENPAFKEYLEQTKEIKSTYNLEYGNAFWDKTRIVFSDEFMREKYVFCEEDITAWDVLYFITEWKNIYSPVPVINSAGDFPFYTYQAEYAISENCQNKELAWEFIKYCISEKSIPEECNPETVKNYVFGNFNARIPINIKNFYNSFHFQIKYDLEYDKNLIDEITKNGGKINSDSGKISDTINKIHQWNQMINTGSAKQEFGNIIGDKMDEFYYSDMSAEEFSEYLQNITYEYIQ